MKRWAVVLVSFSLLLTSESVGAGAPKAVSVRWHTLPARVADLIDRVENLEVEISALRGEIPTVDPDGVLSKFSRVEDDIYLDHANLHIRNGQGATDLFIRYGIGLGNMIVGYNELRSEDPTCCGDLSNVDSRIGSHMLVIGSLNNYGGFPIFAGFGGIVSGELNAANNPYASVTGGRGNRANGYHGSISGGVLNYLAQNQCSLSGGGSNQADITQSWVGGGFRNWASRDSSIVGGLRNRATGAYASVSGGQTNRADGRAPSVSGGRSNHASGTASSVSGGLSNEAFINRSYPDTHLP